MYAISLCIMLVSWTECFIECTVNVYAHALNLNNQYLTFLKVYKSVAWTSPLHMVLVLCTTSFRVVQLMYSPLRVFETTLGITLCYTP